MRHRAGRRRRPKRRRGRGFFDSLKRSHVLSNLVPTALAFIPGVGPIASGVARAGLNMLGLGRRRRRRPRR